MTMDAIVTIQHKKDEAFLRERTKPFPLEDLKDKKKAKEIAALVRRMREAMRRANGVGLSANQIGIPFRVFVAQVSDAQGKQKFYAVFNPELARSSNDKVTTEEGCLSVPEVWGPVERYYRVTLAGYDMRGKKLKLKAWGLLARVFQHEVDHLDGKLFIDRTKKLYTYKPEGNAAHGL